MPWIHDSTLKKNIWHEPKDRPLIKIKNVEYEQSSPCPFCGNKRFEKRAYNQKFCSGRCKDKFGRLKIKTQKIRDMMTASEMGKKSSKLRKKRMGKEYSDYMKSLVRKRKKNPVKNPVKIKESDLSP